MSRNKRYIAVSSNNKPYRNVVRLILFFVISSHLLSCSDKSNGSNPESDKGRKVARVFSRDIYSSDLPTFVKQDSIQLVQTYIEKTAQEEALLEKAKESGWLNMEEIEEKTNQFRNTLISVRYEQGYIDQKLDTNVTEDEIKEYYEHNGSSFMLEETIFKGYYVKVPSNSPKIQRLKELMQSDNPIDLQELKSYCLRHASVFSIDNTQWEVLPVQISENVRIKANNVPYYIRNKQILTAEKDDNLYLIRLFDFKFANEQSPLAYFQDKIKHILLNKRKMQLLGQLREQLLNEAKATKQIEIY